MRTPWKYSGLTRGLLASVLLLAAAVPVQGTGTGHSVSSFISSVPTGAMQTVTVINRSEIELSGIRNLWNFLRARVEFNSYGLDQAVYPWPPPRRHADQRPPFARRRDPCPSVHSRSGGLQVFTRASISRSTCVSVCTAENVTRRRA